MNRNARLSFALVLCSIVLGGCGAGLKPKPYMPETYGIGEDGVVYVIVLEERGKSKKPIPGADANTFEILINKRYARDAKHVFLDGKAVPFVDVSTYHSLGDSSLNFWADKYRVYQNRKPIPGSDPETFTIIDAENGRRYAKDKSSFYYYADRFTPCDPNTFRLIPAKYDSSWARDSKCIYFQGKKVPVRDLASFQNLYSSYSKDKYAVYYIDEKVEGADPNSFKVTVSGSLSRGFYGKDATQCYLEGKVKACDKVFSENIRRQNVDKTLVDMLSRIRADGEKQKRIAREEWLKSLFKNRGKVSDEILEEFKGNILSPENAQDLAISNLPEGFAVALKSVINFSPNIETLVFQGVKGGRAIFYNYSLEQLGYHQREYFSNGVLASASRNLFVDKENQLITDFYHCQFKLGECAFSYSSDAGEYNLIVDSQFNSGVWVSKYEDDDGNQVEQHNIYDVYGLPLYTLAMKNGEPLYEYRRTELKL